jgi:hypothetical protein
VALQLSKVLLHYIFAPQHRNVVEFPFVITAAVFGAGVWSPGAIRERYEDVIT